MPRRNPPIDPAPDAATRPLATTRSARPVRFSAGELVVLHGPDRGRRFVLSPPRARIGKSAQCDIVLTDETVSKQHAIVEERDGHLLLRDLGSTNGTFVDTARVVEVMLEPGTTLRLGGTVIAFEPPEQVPEPAAPRDHFGPLLGTSPKAREHFALLERVAATDLSVLVIGETGTGKELVAQALHEASPRARGPFALFDCSALARELVESSLFGHTEGAFTGATGARKGAVVSADGGTLFIDEIGELDLELQPKLLRVLEKRQVQALGSDQLKRVDVRVIAATHRDLREMARRGQFRQDLYYRLSVVEVHVPALRERREDIPLLAAHFLARVRPAATLAPEAVERLARAPWAGNVRELRNAIERAAALAPGDRIEAADLALSEDAPGATAGMAGDRSLEDIEIEAIRVTLERTGGNRTQAAKILGIARKTLIEKIARHRLG